MSEFSHLTQRAAADQIRERVSRRQRSRMPGQRPRRSGRRALAQGLHSLANRLDA